MDTAKYATAFQASDWLYFLRHGIKYNVAVTIQYDTAWYNTENTIRSNIVLRIKYDTIAMTIQYDAIVITLQYTDNTIQYSLT